MTGGVTGICPHPSDLAISKLVAGRDKDRDFVRTMIRYGIVSVDELQARLDELDADIATRVGGALRRLTV